MKTLIKSIVALGVLSAPQMLASVLVDSYNYTSTTTSPFTSNFTIAQFDPSAGTLTAVEIDLSYSAVKDFSFINTTASPLAYSGVMASTALSLAYPSALTPLALSAVVNLPAGVAASGSSTVTGVTGSGSTSANLATFPAYVGTGTNAFSVTGGGTFISGLLGPPGLFVGDASSLALTASVKYTYTPASTAPEPTTVSLAGFALVGLAITTRKRFSQPPQR